MALVLFLLLLLYLASFSTSQTTIPTAAAPQQTQSGVVVVLAAEETSALAWNPSTLVPSDNCNNGNGCPGSWWVQTASGARGGSVHGTIGPDTAVQLTFTGSSVSVFGRTLNNGAQGLASIDGGPPATFPTQSPDQGVHEQQQLWSSGSLDPSQQHVLKVQFDPTFFGSNLDNSSWLQLDYFQFTTTGSSDSSIPPPPASSPSITNPSSRSSSTSFSPTKSQPSASSESVSSTSSTNLFSTVLSSAVVASPTTNSITSSSTGSLAAASSSDSSSAPLNTQLSHSLPIGAIAGGVVGGLAAVIIAGVAACIFLRRRRLNLTQPDPESVPTPYAPRPPETMLDSLTTEQQASHPMRSSSNSMSYLWAQATPRVREKATDPTAVSLSILPASTISPGDRTTSPATSPASSEGTPAAALEIASDVSSEPVPPPAYSPRRK